MANHPDPAPQPSTARRQPMYHRVFRAENIAVRAALMGLRIRFGNQLEDEVIGRLELALAEVLNNICEHGGIALSLSPEARPPAENRTPAKPAPSIRSTGAGTTKAAAPAQAPAQEASCGRAPTIHLCVIRQSNGIACAVTDDGIPLPEGCLLPFGDPTFSTYRSREKDSPDLPEGGFGWYLIQDLTHAMCYYREDQRNFLAFTVPFADADPAQGGADPQSMRDETEAQGYDHCKPCGPLTQEASSRD